MLKWFKKEKDNPLLPERVVDIINFPYNLDLIKHFLERIKKFVQDRQIEKILFGDKEVSYKQMENGINKELLYDQPCFMFEWTELKLGLMINANICRNSEDSTFIVSFEQEGVSTYLDEILEPKNYLSRFVNNQYFHYRQADHQIVFFEDTRYLNKSIYPGYDPQTETIDKTMNAGYAINLSKFGSFGISQYNEYSMDLLNAISRDKVISALKKLNIPYTLDDAYLKFKLFDNHRESELIKNHHILRKFGELIDKKSFINKYTE